MFTGRRGEKGTKPLLDAPADSKMKLLLSKWGFKGA
jgi:hypothetical protein